MTCSHWRAVGSVDAVQQQLGAPQDRGEEVVEVVRHARGHLAQRAELLAAHQLILGQRQVLVGAGAVLVEPRAAKRQRRQARDVGEHALVGFGEGPVAAAQRQDADHLGAGQHGHADPVRQDWSALRGLHASTGAFPDVVVRPDGPARRRDAGHEPHAGVDGAPRRLDLAHAVLRPQERHHLRRGLVHDGQDHVAGVEEARHLAVDGLDHVLLAQLARDGAGEVVEHRQLGEQRLALLEPEPRLARQVGVVHEQPDLGGHAFDQAHLLRRERAPGLPPDEEHPADRLAAGQGGREEDGVRADALEHLLVDAGIVLHVRGPGRPPLVPQLTESGHARRARRGARGRSPRRALGTCQPAAGTSALLSADSV